MVELPAPDTWAPMPTRKSARSAISGSRAALSMTVVPLASTAAVERVLGGPDAGELEQQRGPDQPVGGGLDVAVGRLEAGAELLEAAHVHVDRARAEVVAAGQGHPGPAVAGHQRTQHVDRRPHALDQLVGGLGHDAGRVVDLESVALAARVTVMPIDDSSSLMQVTSEMSGTLSSR